MHSREPAGAVGGGSCTITHDQRLRIVGDPGTLAFGYSPASRADGSEHLPTPVRRIRSSSPIIEPGSCGPVIPKVGWVARNRPGIPLGYFDDAGATARRSRRSTAARRDLGDRASLENGRHPALFGRDSLVVNTGGEKVFVEEVEDVLRAHPSVADALVVGRPSERGARRVVALVARHPTAVIDDARCRSTARPAGPVQGAEECSFVDQIRRLGNGKADYRWAKRPCGRQARWQMRA